MSDDPEPLILGIDPGLKVSGVALLRRKELLEVDLVTLPPLGGVFASVRGTLMGVKILEWIDSMEFAPDIVVVEGQQIYKTGAANPGDILALAHVSAAVASGAHARGSFVALPPPRKWKGNEPKGINQARTAECLHIPYVFSRPDIPIRVTEWPPSCKRPRKLPSKHVKEIMDAAGLAIWGWRERKRICSDGGLACSLRPV
ncbi:MAG: hypothetical protein D6812_04485 [Deltaproteobacteria bacterium]|nr:MAG: hypothetical protein D6812_04485 [Deltaproteobacteria bacterium]